MNNYDYAPEMTAYENIPEDQKIEVAKNFLEKLFWDDSSILETVEGIALQEIQSVLGRPTSKKNHKRAAEFVLKNREAIIRRKVELDEGRLAAAEQRLAKIVDLQEAIKAHDYYHGTFLKAWTAKPTRMNGEFSDV